MKILVTGSSGFIGAPLTQALRQAGHQVLGFDLRPAPGDLPTVIGDVRDAPAITRACAGMDGVFHLAAEHQDDVHPVRLYEEVNVQGTAHLADAMTEHGVRWAVFTSTVAVYGLAPGCPDENAAPAPFNDYGRTKLAAETVLRNWAQGDAARGLVIVRPTAVFGPGNRGNIYNLVRQIAGRRFAIVGAGHNRKAIAHVQNLTDFMAALAPVPPGMAIFNYADRPDLPIGQIVELVRAQLGIKGRPVRLPYWAGLAAGGVFDIAARLTGRSFPVSTQRVRKFCAETVFDTKRLRDSGFEPRVTLEEGLRQMVRAEFMTPERGPQVR